MEDCRIAACFPQFQIEDEEAIEWALTCTNLQGKRHVNNRFTIRWRKATRLDRDVFSTKN